MALISIIVPVYGVEQYLETCVNSLRNQTLKDIEIILVDDGSKDHCPEMCDAFAKQDSRIKVLHKPNGGVSDARNKGIDLASAEYIMFLDADDFVELNMCEVLYNHLLNNDVQIVVGCSQDMYEGKIVDVPKSFEDCIVSGQEALGLCLLGDKITLYPFVKLYKKSYFDQVRFPLGKIFEDAATLPFIFAQADQVYITSQTLGYYVRRKGSYTFNRFSNKDYDCIEVHYHNLQIIKEKYPSLITHALYRYFWALLFTYDKIAVNNLTHDQKAKQIYKEIKKQAFAMMKNPYLSYKRKIGLLLLMWVKPIYKKVAERQMRWKL